MNSASLEDAPPTRQPLAMSSAEFVRQNIRAARTGLLLDDPGARGGARAVFVAASMAGKPIIGSATPPPDTPFTLVLGAMEGPGPGGPAAIHWRGARARPGDEIRARFARLCDAGAAVQPWLLEPAGISTVDADGLHQPLDVHACLLDLATAKPAAEDQSPRVADNEVQVLEHLNGEHPELVAALAVTVLGEQPGEWRLVGADPEGLDLAVQQRRRRLNFGTPPAWTFQVLRARLKSLLAADSGRAATDEESD